MFFISGLSRPLRTRIENSLISNNSPISTSSTDSSKPKGTINYFLVKNIINFYLQTFSQLLPSQSQLVYTVRELLVLSDKVFYSSLNYYCSSTNGISSECKIQLNGLDPTEHLLSLSKLTDQLLSSIQSSMAVVNVDDHKLETLRIVSAVYDPYMQHLIIHSCQLSSLQMTIFSFNCVSLLLSTLVKYPHTQSFVDNCDKQLTDYIDVLANEQFMHIIQTLSVTSFYNAVMQTDDFTVPLSTLSGCDLIVMNTFLVRHNYSVAFSYLFLAEIMGEVHGGS